MEEIDAGDYVRTKRGIGKILEVKTVKPKMYGKHDLAYLIDTCLKMYITDTEFIKHSKNIIDLIEVGDYVNGKEVHKYNGNTGIVSINELGWTFIAFKDKKYPIETIVTHEQFASMEYKVGE